MSRKETFVWLVILIGLPALMIFACLASFDPDNRYVVVDKRDGCDLVRYNPGPFSKYVYFLKCKNKVIEPSISR